MFAKRSNSAAAQAMIRQDVVAFLVLRPCISRSQSQYIYGYVSQFVAIPPKTVPDSERIRPPLRSGAARAAESWTRWLVWSMSAEEFESSETKTDGSGFPCGAVGGSQEGAVGRHAPVAFALMPFPVSPRGALCGAVDWNTGA